MAQIHFLIRTKKKNTKVPIYVRVHAGRNVEAKVKIPRFVNEKYWDKKNEKVKQLSGFDKEDYSGINESLYDLKAFLFKELYKQTDAELPIDGEWLKKSINLFFTSNEVVVKPQKSNIIAFIEGTTKEMVNGYLLTAKGTYYSKGAINGYKQLITKLNEFTRKKAIPFNRINKKFGNDFINYLINNDLSSNYIGKIISRLKSIMNMARKKGYVTNIEYLDFPVYKEPAENIYLTLEEIEMINALNIEDKIDNNFNPSKKQLTEYEKVKDIFIFACFTGQRISDYKSIRKHNFQKINGANVFSLTQVKTDTPVSIPLRKEVFIIAEKYDFSLPTIPEQKINEKIKILGKLAGIEGDIEVKITRGGKIKKTIYKKYDLIKTHTARRSCITNMVLSEEFTTRQMMSISGHSTEKDFNSYVKAGHKEYLESMIDSQYFNNY